MKIETAKIDWYLNISLETKKMNSDVYVSKTAFQELKERF